MYPQFHYGCTVMFCIVMFHRSPSFEPTLGPPFITAYLFLENNLITELLPPLPPIHSYHNKSEPTMASTKKSQPTALLIGSVKESKSS